jgi:hypothetical protein
VSREGYRAVSDAIVTFDSRGGQPNEMKAGAEVQLAAMQGIAV